KDAGTRETPFLLIVGASGSGKSSLALAGLVPRLTAPGVVPAVDLWRVAVMRPGEHEGGPVAALAARLFDTAADNEDECPLAALPEMASSDYATPAELAKLLAHADESCDKPILKALDRIAAEASQTSGYDRPVRADLLIVIDQLDELFASEVSEAERTRFDKLIAHLVATGRVWVIATLRADLYERFLKEPDLLAMKTKGATYDLAPPGTTEIDEIIRGPAIAAGLVYETDPKSGESLDDRLIGDVDRPDMLPLLQFALDFLFEQRVTADGQTLLAFKAYDTLGGLAGAIDKEAERAIAPLGKDEHEHLPRLLRQLAAPAPSGEAAATAALSIRSVPLTEAAYDPASERLVKALVDARILLSSGSEQNASIRLAHQRVLENWTRAKEIVATNAEFFRIRDDVEALRRRWDKSSKKRDLLIPKGVPLAEAESIAKRYPGELGAPTLGFIAASGKRARLRQRLIAATAVLMAVLAVGATVAGIRAWQAEQTARRNFDVANALVTDIAQGLRNVEGMRAEARKKIFEQVSKTLDEAVGDSPDDEQLLGMQATMFEEFASTHTAEGEQAAAAESTAKMLEIRLRIEEMSEGNQRTQDAALTLERIGELKLDAGDAAGALAAYEKILANRRRAAESNGGSPDRQRDVAVTLATLGDLKLRSGDLQGALAAYQECYGIRNGVAKQDLANVVAQRELAQALSSLGYAKFRNGDYPGALATYDEGLAIARKLAEADPADAGKRRDLGLLVASIGDTKLDSGDNDGALAAYKESLAIRRQLAATDTGNTELKRDIAATLSGIGDAQLNAGDKPNALAAYGEGVVIARELVKIDADNLVWQRDLSISLNRVGDVKRDSGDTPGALASYDESLAIRRRLAAGDPSNVQWRSDEAYVLQRIGDLKRSSNDDRGALAAFEEALAIARGFADENSGADSQRELALN
ncbi:MAG: tetratricopeptide repeat protein, partial [Methyloceanibacter sp.]